MISYLHKTNKYMSSYQISELVLSHGVGVKAASLLNIVSLDVVQVRLPDLTSAKFNIVL